MKWRARISPNPLIIAAASARAFVRAAAASGRRVIAADVFCDLDTREVAKQAVSLDYRHGGFVANDIRVKLFPLLTPETQFLYGSGFETQPELLAEIGQRCRLVGNTPEVVRIIKDPHHFFDVLDRLSIPFPETRFSQPEEGVWLAKTVGGSGGTHILQGGHGPGKYYQRCLAGEPVSLLFAANGRDIVPVGFNLQVLAPVPGMPFRFGGAVSRPDLPGPVEKNMLDAARSITQTFGLVGLNSLDGIVQGQDWWALEINPRLSASFALYDAENSGAALLRLHLGACGGRLPECLPEEASQAHLVYYAPCDLTVPAQMAWPDWVADIPDPGSAHAAQAPLCTIRAAAPTAPQALALAQERAALLAAIVNHF